MTFLVSEQAATDDILNVSASYKTGAVTDSNLMPVDLTIVNGGVAVANPNISPVTEVVGLIEDGKITITLTSTEAVDDAQLFVASYAESGALLGISMESIALISGTKDYFPQNIATGKQYRAFLFNGDMQPYCPVINVQKPPEKFTVRFLDYDNRLISEQTGIEGQSAAAPAAPKRDGYTFVGWSGSYTNVQSDTTVVAQYEEITGPLLVVGTVTARPGDTEVELTVSVRNNPGIMCMALSVGFDDTALTLTGASSGAAVNDVLTMTASPLGNGCKFAWDGESISASQIKDGVVLNMKFSVAANAAAKEYPITVSYQGGAITDGNLQPVMPLINNGKIIVTSQG